VPVYCIIPGLDSKRGDVHNKRVQYVALQLQAVAKQVEDGLGVIQLVYFLKECNNVFKCVEGLQL